jgi:DNA modification methylase
MRDQAWRAANNREVCCGLEIDPKYCDVIIQRWQGMSGRNATLEGDGRTFEQIKTARLEVAA